MFGLDFVCFGRSWGSVVFALNARSETATRKRDPISGLRFWAAKWAGRLWAFRFSGLVSGPQNGPYLVPAVLPLAALRSHASTLLFRTLYEVFEREIASSPLCFARLRTWLKRRRFCERLCRCEARDGVRKNFAVSLKKRIQPKAGGSHGLAPCFAMGSLGKALARMVHNREKVGEVVCSVFLSFFVLIWWCCVVYALIAS